ncbi:phosphotransferase [Streptomyces sp. NPDC058157]|uniref:phosphotransferase n=1 Tax=Streptomyces sp. NPDC058157 TaxID=3346360 RepID=UPI0036E7FA57
MIRDEALAAALPVLAHEFRIGEVRAYRYLAEGLMNRNYRIETAAGVYAVKEIGDVPLERVRRNLGVLPDLAAEGIPVPVALTSESGETVVETGGHGYCVLPWVAGSHVEGTDLPVAQAGELGVLLGRLHEGLRHHAPGPVPEHPPISKVRPAERADEAARALMARLPETPFGRAAGEALSERQELLARLGDRHPAGEEPAGPFGWTHGDFQYRNLLRDAGGDVVAIVDWDRLGVRPYAEEVARTAQVQFGVGGSFDLERISAFVSGYRSVLALSAADLADGVNRLWWKRLTDFWQLEFFLDRHDDTFGEMFLADEALLRWWTDRLGEVQAAYAAH